MVQMPTHIIRNFTGLPFFILREYSSAIQRRNNVKLDCSEAIIPLTVAFYTRI